MNKTKKIKYCQLPETYSINGSSLHLYHIPNNTLHVSAMVIGGKFKETKKNSGISHLLEHVLTNSYIKCNYIDCRTFFQTKGIKYNAITGNNYIQYWISGLISNQDLLLDYIINTINYPKIIKENFEKEKKAVESEITRNINYKTYELHNKFAKNFYKIPSIKYSNDYELQLANLKKFTIDDLYNWFERYYNNISYFVVGDFKTNDILNLFKKQLPLFKPYIFKISYDELFSLKKNKILYIHNNDQKIVNLSIAFPVNILVTNSKFQYIQYITSILQNILLVNLRSKKDLVYSIFVNSNLTISYTTVTISCNVITEKANEVIQYILYLLNYYKSSLVSQDEINSFKKKAKYEYYNTINNNTNSKVFSQYNNQLYLADFDNKFKIRTVCQDIDLISKINPKIFNNLMREIFNFNTMFITYQSSRKIY